MKRFSLIFLSVLLLAGFGGCEKAEAAALSFHSFDGGGPRYSVVIADESIVACSKSVKYQKRDHALLDGAGYDVTFTFTGLRAGETTVTVERRSPIGGDADLLYAVRVDERLHVTIELLSEVSLDEIEEQAEAVQPVSARLYLEWSE